MGSDYSKKGEMGLCSLQKGNRTLTRRKDRGEDVSTDIHRKESESVGDTDTWERKGQN
jgi:hypothetical protein